MKFNPFKKWHFWVALAIATVFNLVSEISMYGRVFLSIILGTIIGNVIILVVVYFLIYRILLVGNWKKRKKKVDKH